MDHKGHMDHMDHKKVDNKDHKTVGSKDHKKVGSKDHRVMDSMMVPGNKMESKVHMVMGRRVEDSMDRTFSVGK